MALVDIRCHQLANIFEIVAWGEDTLEAHLFKLGFDVREVMFPDHQIAADVQKDIANTAFDAALAQPQAVNVAMTINGRNDN